MKFDQFWDILVRVVDHVPKCPTQIFCLTFGLFFAYEQIINLSKRPKKFEVQILFLCLSQFTPNLVSNLSPFAPPVPNYPTKLNLHFCSSRQAFKKFLLGIIVVKLGLQQSWSVMKLRISFKGWYEPCPKIPHQNLPNHLSHITPPHINYIFTPFQNLCRGFLLRLSSQGRIQHNYEVWFLNGHCTQANGHYPLLPAQYFSPICPILPHKNWTPDFYRF